MKDWTPMVAKGEAMADAPLPPGNTGLPLTDARAGRRERDLPL